VWVDRRKQGKPSWREGKDLDIRELVGRARSPNLYNRDLRRNVPIHFGVRSMYIQCSLMNPTCISAKLSLKSPLDAIHTSISRQVGKRSHDDDGACISNINTGKYKSARYRNCHQRNQEQELHQLHLSSSNALKQGIPPPQCSPLCFSLWWCTFSLIFSTRPFFSLCSVPEEPDPMLAFFSSCPTPL
jgi:hypothetical protein